MKKLCLLLVLCLLLSGCNSKPESTDAATSPATTTPVAAVPEGECPAHADEDRDGFCDICTAYVLVTIDFYNINDLHGKIADADTHPGVDELSTYLKNARETDDHAIFLSTGDMWQGSSESNLTQGRLATDWMNEMGFAAMTLGNHEYDWGEEPIEDNFNLAQFPFLAINIYDRETNKQVSYVQSSHVVDLGDAQVGIIGAMGDCYSSISADKVEDVYFITGDDLTKLVKDEATKLRQSGVDYIVYLIHDGYGESKSNSVTDIIGTRLRSYYNTVLSSKYVDLVFEGHTHQSYILKDEHGVYHLQNKGDNKGGISHVEITLNIANLRSTVDKAELVSTGKYARLDDHPVVADLMKKYQSDIDRGNEVLGSNASTRNGVVLRDKVAQLYFEAGQEIWGDAYDIVLGGGFMSVRSPGELAPGEVTYGLVYSLFPFDNQLVLCSIKGRDLQKRFVENDDYFLYYGQYGQNVKNNIDPDATYYLVTDTYSSLYGPNKLTEVARYEEKVYARDLLADYIRDGGYSS